MDWSSWTWTAPLVGAIAGAGITGFVTSRSTRKHPYELLKNLVEIHQNLSQGLDPNGVIASAIEAELQVIERSRDWDRRHPILRWWTEWGWILVFGNTFASLGWAVWYLVKVPSLPGIFSPTDLGTLIWLVASLLTTVALIVVFYFRPSSGDHSSIDEIAEDPEADSATEEDLSNVSASGNA